MTFCSPLVSHVYEVVKDTSGVASATVKPLETKVTTSTSTEAQPTDSGATGQVTDH